MKGGLGKRENVCSSTIPPSTRPGTTVTKSGSCLGPPTQEGESPGRARLRPNRGCQRGPARQCNPSQMLARTAHAARSGVSRIFCLTRPMAGPSGRVTGTKQMPGVCQLHIRRTHYAFSAPMRVASTKASVALSMSRPLRPPEACTYNAPRAIRSSQSGGGEISYRTGC
jgi:hypothetical protein